MRPVGEFFKNRGGGGYIYQNKQKANKSHFKSRLAVSKMTVYKTTSKKSPKNKKNKKYLLKECKKNDNTTPQL